MATFTLIPDGTTGTNNWQCSTGSDFVDLVDEDDDSTFVYETLLNNEINYTFPDPPVAEGAMDFDEDVTVSAFVHAHYTSTSATVNMQITTNGTGILLPGATTAVDNSAYPAYAGRTGITKTLFAAWDYAGIQNLQMKIKPTSKPARYQYLRVSYIFFTVDYTAAAVVTADNATFFGANF